MSERLRRSAAPFVGDAVWREGFRVSDLMLGLIDLSKKMPFGKWEKENTKGIMLRALVTKERRVRSCSL